MADRPKTISRQGSNAMEGEFYQRDRRLHPPALTPHYKTSVTRARRATRCCRCRIRSPRSPARCSATTTSARSTTTSSAITPTTARPSASGSSSTAACSTRTPGPCRTPWWRFWQANAGGRYRHKKDTLSRAHRPQLRRLRPGDHRRGRASTASARSSPAPIPGGTGSTAGARPTSTSRSSVPASPSASSRRCTSRAIR